MIFPYSWKLKDGYTMPKNGLKVFSTFACGGGSTMGYKLAGFDVIGANDIDPKMAEVYEINHQPTYYFLNPISDLLGIDLPTELYNIDILDGSPPCSTFSVAGQREKNWGKLKMFREGQSEQVLSNLFFEFIKLAGRLRPKIIIAENVKGMIMGNARIYIKNIIKEYEKIGYKTQIFILNGATMGLPQRRERIFFISQKMDNYIDLNMNFSEKPVIFSEISDSNDTSNGLTLLFSKYWNNAKQGSCLGKFNSSHKCKNHEVAPTLTSKRDRLYHPLYPRRINESELCKIGSFPSDYNYLDISPNYLIGMSVPPVMIAQISYQIYLQLFKNGKAER